MLKTNPLSINDISEMARSIRKGYGMGEEECFPILEYLDYLYDNDYVTISILDNDDPYLKENIPAVYNALDNCIYIKESVIYEIYNCNYRSNFTLAHELFHYLQNQVLGFSFEDVEERKTYEDPEWQANTFAGILLLPTESLDKDDEYLVNHFKVSLECVLTRKAQTKRRKNQNRK